MSKKKHPNETIEEQQRRSRKEVLVARKEAQQKRQIWIAAGIVGAIILAVILLALINELLISPNRTVASVGDDTIALNEFQDRVVFERTQRIVLLENQLEAFNGDVGIIQQFASQLIIDLLPSSSDTFGESILEQMVDETLLEQAAAERGLSVSEEEVDEAIGADFNYFGGGLPTPAPSATETIVPTPSLTPIPTAVITELLPTATSFPTPTQGPTATPFPTATPVSEEAFQTEFSEFFADYKAFGVSEAEYRESIRLRLLRDKLIDDLAEELGLPTQAEHASILFIAALDEAEIQDALALVETEGFLTAWNTIRSRPFDPEASATIVASEMLRQSEADLAQNFGETVAAAAFSLDVETPSAVLVNVGEDGSQQYFIIMVSGREVLDLSDSALQQQEQNALQNFLQGLRDGNVVVNNFWRGRVPTQPILDAKFLAQPTATPALTQPELLPDQ